MLQPIFIIYLAMFLAATLNNLSVSNCLENKTIFTSCSIVQLHHQQNAILRYIKITLSINISFNGHTNTDTLIDRRSFSVPVERYVNA